MSGMEIPTTLRSAVDTAVLGVCELLGLIFGLPFGDDLFHDHPVTPQHVIYLIVGIIFAAIGPLWLFCGPRFVSFCKKTALRQEANRDIIEFINGPFQKFLELVKSSVQKIDSTLVSDEIIILSQLKDIYVATWTKQYHMLRKYDGIGDVFELADWNFLAKEFEPALDDAIMTFRVLPADGHAIRYGGQSSIAKYLQSVDRINIWINNTLRNVGTRRSELDQLQVRD